MDAKEYYQLSAKWIRFESRVGKKALDAGLAAQQILNDGLIGG